MKNNNENGKPYKTVILRNCYSPDPLPSFPLNKSLVAVILMELDPARFAKIRLFLVSYEAFKFVIRDLIFVFVGCIKLKF